MYDAFKVLRYGQYFRLHRNAKNRSFRLFKPNKMRNFLQFCYLRFFEKPKLKSKRAETRVLEIKSALWQFFQNTNTIYLTVFSRVVYRHVF